MRKVFLILFLLGIVLSLFAEPNLFLDNTVTQGSVLRLIVFGEKPLPQVTAALSDSHTREISSAVGFSLNNSSTENTSVLILGVPSTVSPGGYFLSVSGIYGEGAFSLTREITVLSRFFVAEEIRLNEKMSDLRQIPDPQKEQETKELVELVNTTRPTALYHTGRFRLPLTEIRKTSTYGDRRTFLYSDGGSARSIHYGIDYGAPQGTKVFAVGDGVVVFAANRILTGNTVIIEHLPGVYSLYYHLNSIDTTKDAFVLMGETIGTVGATGLATGNHLHWEIRVGGVPVEPEIFLNESLLDKDSLFDKIQ